MARPLRQIRLWDDAVTVLETLLDGYQTVRDGLPDSLVDTAYAAKLDAVLELRAEVEALRAADLPKGFGRD